MVPSSILAEDNDNLTAMLEGRKLSGIPRHKIYEEDDCSPHERLQRQCLMMVRANRQRRVPIYEERKGWRKPTIRIHTYPKTTLPMAAE
jgi:hypothetical protein